MNNKLKYFTFLLTLCIAILLTAFLLSIFDIIDLRIINKISVPEFWDFVLSVLLFSINMFFLISFGTQVFNSKVIKFVLLYIPIYIISFKLFGNTPFSTILIPLLYIILISSKLKSNSKYLYLKAIIYTALSFVILAIYEYLSITVKMSNFDFNIYENCNAIVAVIFSVDMFIFYILCYIINKEVLEYVVRRRLGQKSDISSKEISFQVTEEPCEENLDLSDLKPRQKLVFYLLAIGYQVGSLGAVILLGFVNSVPIELMAMLLVFFIGRKILGKCWHSNTLMICSCVTLISFYILTKITLPFTVSLFTASMLSASFTYGLYVLAIKEDEINNLKAELKELKKPKKTISDLRLPELITLCEKHLNKNDYEFFFDMRNKKLSKRAIADKYCTSESNTYNWYKSLQKKLNEFIAIQ